GRRPAGSHTSPGPTLFRSRLAAVAVAGALSLVACGTDDNTPAGSSGTASASASAAANDSGLSGTINAAGSSAQANAIDEWKKGLDRKSTRLNSSHVKSSYA